MEIHLQSHHWGPQLFFFWSNCVFCPCLVGICLGWSQLPSTGREASELDPGGLCTAWWVGVWDGLLGPDPRSALLTGDLFQRQQSPWPSQHTSLKGSLLPPRNSGHGRNCLFILFVNTFGRKRTCLFNCNTLRFSLLFP